MVMLFNKLWIHYKLKKEFGMIASRFSSLNAVFISAQSLICGFLLGLLFLSQKEHQVFFFCNVLTKRTSYLKRYAVKLQFTCSPSERLVKGQIAAKTDDL